MVKLDYVVRGVRVSDINDCYIINCESYKEYDENLDLEVLPKEFPSEKEFEKLLQKKESRAILFEEKHGGFVEPKGFAIFLIEIENHLNTFNILAIESSDKDTAIKEILIKEIIKKANKSTLKTVIYFSIPETKLELVKLAFSLGFTKKEILFSKDSRPDIIVMEFRKE